MADIILGPDVAAMRGFGGQASRDPLADHFAFGGRHTRAIGTTQALHLAFTHVPSFLAQERRDASVSVAQVRLAQRA